MLTVPEVLDILKEANITDSRQVVLKWIRDGKIKAESVQGEKHGKGIYKKMGYQISQQELERFISEKNPHFLEVKRLQDKVKHLENKVQKLKGKSNSNQKEQHTSNDAEPNEEQKSATSTKRVKHNEQQTLFSDNEIKTTDSSGIRINGISSAELDQYLRMPTIQAELSNIIAQTKKAHTQWANENKL
ncbi:helix-turn-helix domain-containing protein [Hazenella sp. IB182357]|uniref:Helix-turn-helix domain-containing protein n=1 Tax=Polycladospora coralii TaxID=2771432 RepID=A0A926RYU5_9BACL|nr:helix-turn-helix domain-containing protein [Polycladospora coralii]MBD1373831.1 helix-turn-helix domain-containing protein [Polycladospora coralii]